MKIESTIDPRSEPFQANRAAMAEAVARLRYAGGGAKYVGRHKEWGKLPPGDRVELLLHEGLYFREFAPLAGTGKL